MTIVQDPTGGTVGTWQAGSHFGTEVFNEVGALVWNEFMTRDYDAAKSFFADVFGYTYTELGDDNFKYSTIEVGGTTVGGIGTSCPSSSRPRCRRTGGCTSRWTTPTRASRRRCPRCRGRQSGPGHALRPPCRPGGPAGRSILGDQAGSRPCELTGRYPLDSTAAPPRGERAALAQSAEHLTRNEVVRGSIPRGGSIQASISGSLIRLERPLDRFGSRNGHRLVT